MPANPQMHLVEKLLDLSTIDQKPTRNGYGDGLLELGKKNPNVVILCADLTYIHRDV